MKKGFTLIEILVVATLIGLLAVVGVTSYTVVSRQSRDVKRKGDLDQIRTAIELFKSNSPVNSYPDASALSLSCSSVSALTDSGGTVYLSKQPHDPKCDSGQRYYYQPMNASGGSCNSSDTSANPCVDYTIAARLEGETTVCLASQCGGTGCTYCAGPLGQK